MTGLTIDGVYYRCRVTFPSLRRAFSVIDGGQGGTSLTGGTIRDILGTAYSYTLTIQPDPAVPGDYDLLYALVSNQADSHTVTFPFAQRSITFSAMITAGTDTYDGKQAGIQRWKDLSLTFTPIEPQSNGEEIVGADISFEIDLTSGILYRVTAPSYSGPVFTLNGDMLEVTS